MTGEPKTRDAAGLGCLVVGDDTALTVAVRAALEAAGAQVAGAPVADSREQAERAIADARQSIGEMTALVSCPPAVAAVSIDELTPAAFDAALAASFRSPFLYTQAAFPSLRATPHGRLVYVTSTLGITARPDSAHVAAAERAVITLMRTAALEAGSTVTANVVATSDTGQGAESVIDAILLLLRPESSYLRGQVLTTAGSSELHT